MKIKILIFTTLLISLIGKAQTNPQNSNIDKHNKKLKQELQNVTAKAPFVFEGKVISGEDYYNKAHTGIFTKYTIRITKTLKGAINDSLIELIKSEEDINISFNGQVNELRKNIKWDFNGVFFCFPSKYEIDENFNKSKLYLSEYGSVLIPFNNNILHNTGYVANYGSLNINSFSELYDILGFQQLSEAQLKLEKNNEAGSITQKEYEEYLKNKALIKKKTNVNVVQKSSSTTDLDLSIQNGVVTGTTTKFYEFDIYASTTTSNIYLDGMQVDIQYGTPAFGSSVVTNSLTSLITVTRGTSFPSANYPYFYKTDNTSNVLRINLDNLGSPNRVLLPTIPTVLFHVKIKVNCGQDVNLSFPTTGITGGAWENGATVPFSNNIFSPVNATSTDNTVACNVNITNFNPSIINAGRGEILTIDGANFGSTQGTGYISLKSAEDGGLSDLILDADDYLSWSDNQIKVVIPSYSRVGSSSSPISSSVGSGVITVYNGSNTFSSTNPLTVYYSQKNYLETTAPFPSGFSSRKQKIYVTGEPISYAQATKLPIKIDYTGASAFPGSRGCIEKAVRDWICETNIPFKLVGDTTYVSNMPSNSSAGTLDGISTIHFTNFTLDPTILPSTIAQTFLRAKRCDTIVGGRTIGAMPEFDIEFDLNRAWFCDTIITQNKPANKYDFYEVILHELGHVNLLKHNNDFNSIMYFYSEFTSSTFWGSRRINIRINDYQGGGAIINESKNVQFASFCSYLAVTPDYKCGQAGVHENSINENDIIVKPNPFANNLLVSIKLNKSSNIKLTIYDVYGRMIEVLDDSKNNIDNFNFEYDGTVLSSGIYFMQFIINGEQIIKKIVKQ